MIDDPSIVLISAISSFLGALVGSLLGCRMAWRAHFVTREEAIEMARVIGEQRKLLEQLQGAMQNIWHS